MSQDDSSPPVHSRSLRRARRPRRFDRLSRLWSEWWVEILIVSLVALGIFLLVERMQIRLTLLGWLLSGLHALGALGNGLIRGVVNFVHRTTLSDLIGYVLLLSAVVFVLWRLRWRLMTTPRFTERVCPHCGGELHRIHRHGLDRVASLFVPLARYRCKNSECQWQGLRVKSSRGGAG